MDELILYLKRKYTNNFITGDENCNLLVWGKKDINNNVTPLLLTITIGVAYDCFNADENEIRNQLRLLWNNTSSAFRSLYKYGQRLSIETGFDFGIICFPTNGIINNGEVLNPGEVHFLKVFSRDSINLTQGSLCTGNELKRQLYEIIGLNDGLTGTYKAKNRSVADYFHSWSRGYLSPALIKMDIDGMLVNIDEGNLMQRILIEIKRSNIPPIPEWRPYDRDLPDFQLMFSLSERIHSQMWILHHDGLEACTDNTIVSLFKPYINNSKMQYIDFPSIKLSGIRQENNIELMIRDVLNLRN